MRTNRLSDTRVNRQSTRLPHLTRESGLTKGLLIVSLMGSVGFLIVGAAALVLRTPSADLPVETRVARKEADLAAPGTKSKPADDSAVELPPLKAPDRAQANPSSAATETDE